MAIQAAVVVDNLETGVERRTVHRRSGRYLALSLSVGRYRFAFKNKTSNRSYGMGLHWSSASKR